MSTNRPYVTFSRKQFDSGVVEAGPLPSITTETAELSSGNTVKLRDEVLDQLGTMFTSDCFTKAEKQRIQEWISDRFLMNEQVSEFMRIFWARTAAQVEEQWEEAKAAVRKQQKVIEDFNNETALLQREHNRLVEIKGKTLHELLEARTEREQLSRFASRKQLESANLLVTQRETVATEAELEAANIQGILNRRAMVEMQRLVEKLNSLMNEERRLNHEVTGIEYTDEFGIVHRARR